jgi:hypothetical protein
MHLQAVLVFVLLPRHGLQVPVLPDRFYELCIDGEVSERGAIFTTRCRCGARQAPVVGGTKQKDALAGKVSFSYIFKQPSHTHSSSRRFCRPMQRQALSTSIRRACTS